MGSSRMPNCSGGPNHWLVTRSLEKSQSPRHWKFMGVLYISCIHELSGRNLEVAGPDQHCKLNFSTIRWQQSHSNTSPLDVQGCGCFSAILPILHSLRKIEFHSSLTPNNSCLPSRIWFPGKLRLRLVPGHTLVVCGKE